MSEKDLQRKIMRTLRQTGNWCCKVPAGLIKTQDGRLVSMGVAGQPDLVCGIRDGNTWHIAFCEVKIPSGSLSEGQKMTIKDHIDHGRMVLIADSLDDVLQWLKDPSYHGKEKWLKKLHEVKHYKPRPFKGTIGLKGTEWEKLAEARDIRIRLREEEIGPVPF